MIQVESQMDLGFFDTGAVVGKFHRRDCVNQLAVNSDQITKIGMKNRHELFRLFLQPLVHLNQPFQRPGVYRLKKRASADSFRRGDMGFGEFVLFKDLQQLPA